MYDFKLVVKFFFLLGWDDQSVSGCNNARSAVLKWDLMRRFATVDLNRAAGMHLV
jgi:hypothetical protein